VKLGQAGHPGLRSAAMARSAALHSSTALHALAIARGGSVHLHSPAR